MKTIHKFSSLLSFVALLAVFALPLAGSAQVVSGSYYGGAYYPIASNPSYSYCVNLTHQLSYGSRDYSTGNDVSALQNFLVSKGYLNAVVTGYFGTATYSAVINFQRAYGLAADGAVGPLTRAQIYSVSCNGASSPIGTPTYPTYPTYPSYPTYPGYGYNSYTPVINSVTAPTSLAVNQQGTWTVNANTQYTTYNSYNNALTYSVNWGDQYNYGYSSVANCLYGYVCSNNASNVNNGQNSTFTHSYSTAGTYTATFTVTNSSGQSAQTTSTVYVSGNNNCYNNSYNYNSYYNNTCNGGYTHGTPSISSISPTQANIGTQVTVYGTNFTSTGNSVIFGSGAINNISSYDGRTLTFNVPTYLNANCQAGYLCAQYATQLQNGTYALSVQNSNGTSNQITFTIGKGSYNNGGYSQTLTSVSPSSAPVNTQVTLYGSNFTSNETVHFGSSVINNVYSNGNTLTFYIPSQQSCTYQQSGGVSTNCGFYYQPTTNGTYQIYVTDQYGSQQSNSISFNVTGNTNGTTGNGPVLSSVTSNARIGNTVTVYGTGFDYSNNTILINGAQVASNVYSYSNGYLQFTLPQYAGSQYLYPGSTYQLSVQNQSGYTSNAISFTVGY